MFPSWSGVGIHSEDRFQGDAAGHGLVEPDLAVVLVDAAVVGAGEAGDDVGAAVGPPRPFELAAAGDLVVGELLAGGHGGRDAVGDVDPFDLEHGAGLGGLRQVGDVLTVAQAAHRLQCSRCVACRAGPSASRAPCRR